METRTRDECTVHPHVCGDFVPLAGTCQTLCGSPPRMWGLQVPDRTGQAVYRFTPTYVGTSWLYSVSRALISVHPHVCGDFNGNVAIREA